VTDLDEVTTDRLILRRMEAEDWAAQLRLDGDPRVMATLGGLRPPERTQAYAEEQARHWAEHGFGWWALLDRETEELVGRGGIRFIELEEADRPVEVGYALVPERWGEGLATEVAREAVHVGREVLGLDRIVGLALPTNTASRRVLEKVGLEYRRDIVYKGFPSVLYEWIRSEGSQG
jgi:ribosomal-protein-alanine N-acetyltransferase